MAKSIFIAIEGIDGAGKGEVMNRLQAKLFSLDKRLRILTTREPTYGVIGMQIRAALVKDKDPQANMKKYLDWYCRDREEHVTSIIVPFLSAAKGENIHVILCDRYLYSTLAFQQAQGATWEQVWSPNTKFPVPNKVIILDLDPQVALSRIGGREKEKFEELSMMHVIRMHFLDLPKKLPQHPIVVVDASKSKTHVASVVWREIAELI